MGQGDSCWYLVTDTEAQENKKGCGDTYFVRHCAVELGPSLEQGPSRSRPWVGEDKEPSSDHLEGGARGSPTGGRRALGSSGGKMCRGRGPSMGLRRHPGTVQERGLAARDWSSACSSSLHLGVLICKLGTHGALKTVSIQQIAECSGRQLAQHHL